MIEDELRAEAERHARLSAMLPEPDELLFADDDELAAMLDKMALISDEMCTSNRRQRALLEQIVKGAATAAARVAGAGRHSATLARSRPR